MIRHHAVPLQALNKVQVALGGLTQIVKLKVKGGREGENMRCCGMSSLTEGGEGNRAEAQQGVMRGGNTTREER